MGVVDTLGPSLEDLAVGFGLSEADLNEFEAAQAETIQEWLEFFPKSPVFHQNLHKIAPDSKIYPKFTEEGEKGFFLVPENLKKLENAFLFLPDSDGTKPFADTFRDASDYFHLLRSNIFFHYFDSEGQLRNISQEKEKGGILSEQFLNHCINNAVVAPFFTTADLPQKTELKVGNRILTPRKIPKPHKARMNEIRTIVQQEGVKQITRDPFQDFRFLFLLGTNKAGDEELIEYLAQTIPFWLFREKIGAAFPVKDILTTSNYFQAWTAFINQHKKRIHEVDILQDSIKSMWKGATKKPKAVSDLLKSLNDGRRRTSSLASATQNRTRDITESATENPLHRLSEELKINWGNFRKNQGKAEEAVEKFDLIKKATAANVEILYAPHEDLPRILQRHEIIDLLDHNLEQFALVFFYLPSDFPDKNEALESLFININTLFQHFEREGEEWTMKTNISKNDENLAIFTTYQSLSSIVKVLAKNPKSKTAKNHQESKKQEAIGTISDLLYREQFCLIPLKNNFKQEELLSLWKLWCEKYKSLLGHPGSATRSAFLNFWDGMENVPDQLRPFLAQAPLSELHRNETKKNGNGIRNNHGNGKKKTPPPPRPVLSPLLSEKPDPFMRPLVEAGEGQNAFRITNLSAARAERENVGLWIKIGRGDWQEVAVSIDDEGSFAFSEAQLRDLGMRPGSQKTIFRFAPEKSAPADLYPATATELSVFIPKAPRSPKPNASDKKNNGSNNPSTSPTNSSITPEKESRTSAAEEHLFSAIELFESDHGLLETITDAVVSRATTSFQLEPEILELAEIAEGQLTGVFEIKNDQIIPAIKDHKLRQKLTQIAQAIQAEEEKKQAEAGVQTEIREWETSCPELLARFRQARRVYNKYLGEWMQNTENKKDYWWNLVWQTPMRGFSEELSKLQTECQNAGITFQVSPELKKGPIKSIQFDFAPSSEKKISGTVKNIGEHLEVRLNNESQIPPHWQKEAKNMGIGIFQAIIELAHKTGHFKPRVEAEKAEGQEDSPKAKERRINLVRAGIENISKKSGRIAQYNEAGTYCGRIPNMGWRDLLQKAKDEGEIELVLRDSKINISENGNGSKEKIYAKLRAVLDTRLKKYLALRLLATVRRANNKTPFSGRAKDQALTAVEQFGLSVEYLEDRNTTPSDLLGIKTKDPHAGIEVDLIDFLLNRWEEENESPEFAVPILAKYDSAVTIDLHDMLFYAEQNKIPVPANSDEAQILLEEFPGLIIEKQAA